MDKKDMQKKPPIDIQWIEAKKGEGLSIEYADKEKARRLGDTTILEI